MNTETTVRALRQMAKDLRALPSGAIKTRGAFYKNVSNLEKELSDAAESLRYITNRPLPKAKAELNNLLRAARTWEKTIGLLMVAIDDIQEETERE